MVTIQRGGRSVLRRRRISVVAVLVAGALAGLPAVAGAQSYTVKTLHFNVTAGPAGAERQCNIIGDLYKPADATAAHPDPAVLTTNGFGGSKADQAAMAKELASTGYVVLSYSGLGFGGSGCPIELDDPDWDGRAASQLITFLGGGMSATDGTKVDYVVHDPVAHDGQHHAFDPRVGMIGGSYGGEVQFAAAEQDPRLDTIVPIITWNDLTYSLGPNNVGLPPTVPSDSVSATVPGVAKFIWINAFFGEGAAVDGIQQLSHDPTADLTGCPNFNSQVCSAAIQTNSTGSPPASAITLLRHASVESYMSRIRIPTLLAQGENDTLFQLHEAVATYQALHKQGTPVKMIWQSWGHSQSTPAPGELGDGSGGYSAYDAAGHITYEGQTIQEWFGHYLKDNPAAPPLDFSFFRPWVKYTGDAAPAYGRAPGFPVGQIQNLDLSGTNALVTKPSAVQSGQSTFATPAAGAPTSYSEISAVEMNTEPGREPSDPPGSFAQYKSPPLAQNTDVVGIPTVNVKVSAPLQAANPLGPVGDLVLFFKLYDLSPSGFITLPDKLIAPVRIPAPGATIHVDLPGIVHRFPAGDRIALVIAAGDQAYRGNNVAGPVTISTSPSAPGVLRLPVAGAGSYGPVVYASAPSAPGGFTAPGRPGCPRATGRLAGRRLGLVSLGMTRARTRHAYRKSSARRHRYMDFFCVTPNGIRVGYASPKLLRFVPGRQRRALADRVVLALTANPHYTLRGVRPGVRVATVAKRLKAGRPFHVGLNFWYLTPNGASTGVLKVRHGRIEEVGVANRALTRSRAAGRRFLRSFF
ncbi:MAG: CocE/NonD family hydrolase [Solirubrobacteraceae bacterium]